MVASIESEAFDPFEYLQFLRARWRFPAVAVGIAAAAAVAVCLILPKQYTATATLVIEPPGSDPRAAIAVSPIYLESLKSYETLASSDSLFARAAERFYLLDSTGATLESLKRRVLRVEKLKDTKVLQISVTLPDPKQAQALVQYLAEQTVALDRSIADSGDRALLEDAQQKLAAAQKRFEKAQAEAAAAEGAGSEAALESDTKAIAGLKSQIDAERIEASSLLAESLARGDQTAAAAARARLNAVTTELAKLEKELSTKSAALSALEARQQSAAGELRDAEELFEAARKRADDAANSVKFRAGQLHIVDPGIVPQRPGFPNLPLAALSAAVLSAGACLLWLTLQ